MNLLSKFLIFCSGASGDILVKCPGFELVKYTAIGAIILLTTILAFVSSFFAFSLIFDNIFYITTASLFWSLIIFNLDRFIVMSLKPSDSFIRNLLQSIPRLLIGIIVALIISKPIEIKLFENEINNYFKIEKVNQIKSLKFDLENNLQLISENKDIIEEKFNKNKILVEKYKDEYLCEAAGTCGTKIRGRGQEYKSRKERWISANYLLKEELKKKDSLFIIENNKEIRLIKEFNDEQVIINNLSPGFFDKVKSLSSINKIATNFILLLFILVEISPILSKVLSSKGPYDILILQAEMEFETEFLKSSDSMKMTRSKNKLMNKIDAEIELKIKQNGIKNIDRQDAFERYERLKNKYNNED